MRTNDRQFLDELDAIDMSTASRDDLLAFDLRWCLGLAECTSSDEQAEMSTNDIRWSVDVWSDRAADSINSREATGHSWAE